jgi:hypothetical protein
MKAAVERFVHNANVEHYRRLIAESERDTERDEDRHKTLLTLLAEEIAKDKTVSPALKPKRASVVQRLLLREEPERNRAMGDARAVRPPHPALILVNMLRRPRAIF